MQSLVLSELSIEQKIGQMLLARPPINKKDKEYIHDLIQNHALGGIHGTGKYRRFDSDLEGDERDEVREYNAIADYPLLICEDMEFGYARGEIQLPPPLAIASTGSEELAYEFGRITAIEARSAGYNTVFGPLLDIAMNPRSSCLGPRTFGNTKELVARLATAAIKGYQDQGMVVAAKHYPGFGESHVDSHMGMVYLQGDETSLIEREIYPYIRAMQDADLSGVMVGHIMVPKIDAHYPASLSPKLIGLLRQIGFNGLIMTDSFSMVGVTNLFGMEECHRLAMMAGNDMVMTNYRIGVQTAYEYMLKAYRDGCVSECQIDAAVTRVIAAQNRTLRIPTQTTITQKEKNAAAEMAKRAIAVTLNQVDSAAIDVNQKHLFIIEQGNPFIHPESGKLYHEMHGLDVAVRLLKEKFVHSDFVKIDEFPSKVEIEYVLNQTIPYDSVVMITFNKSVSYMGSSDLTNRQLAFMEAISHKLAAVILFGNPYAARQFIPVPRLIYGFDNALCQTYAVKALADEHIPSGHLPVRVQ
jgi:beta-N-acetylhexosaminidase